MVGKSRPSRESVEKLKRVCKLSCRTSGVEVRFSRNMLYCLIFVLSVICSQLRSNSRLNFVKIFFFFSNGVDLTII